MALYSDKVMDHFQNPRNVGKIEDADGIGEVGNAKCGDIMRMYIKVSDGVITDCKFNTFGCGSAIATSSMATELIKGKPIEEALELSNKAVRLTGCPPISCTARCWPRRLSRPPSRTITTRTALLTTPSCSKTSRTASTATNKTRTLPHMRQQTQRKTFSVSVQLVKEVP